MENQIKLISEIVKEINNRLTPQAYVYFTTTTDRDEFIILAQREGISKAVELIEHCSF